MDTHVVLKPFYAEERHEVVQPLSPFTPSDSSRARDLERLGLIVRADLPAPSNKAAPLALNKGARK